MRTTTTLRWTVFAATLLVTVAFVIASASIPGAGPAVRPVRAQDESSPTPAPTATKEMFALTKPATEPPGDIPEYLLTMTAVEAGYDLLPTATPGISAIAMDGRPHFVDFNAYWCSPCNQMRPAVADMEAKYKDQITFDDINVDTPESDKLSRKYRVVAIPLMVLLDKDHKIVLRLEGYQTAAELDAALSKLVQPAETAEPIQPAA